MEINDNLFNYSPLSADSHPLSEPCDSPGELVNELYDGYFDEHTSPLNFSSDLSTSSANGSEQTSPTEIYNQVNVNIKKQKTPNKLTQNGAKKTTKTKKTRTKTLPKKFPLFISPNLPTEEELSMMNQTEFAKFWERLKEYPLADQDRLRHIKRRIKNRESASASRMRKRTYTEELEKVNSELENEKNRMLEQYSFACNERDAFRQHAQALYNFAVQNGLTFDIELEQEHVGLGLKEKTNNEPTVTHMNSLSVLNSEFPYDTDVFVEDQVVPMNGITIPTGTEEDELQYSQMDNFFGSMSTKFTVLSIFAIAALVLCVSAPATMLLRSENSTPQTQTQTQIDSLELATVNPQSVKATKESFRTVKGIRNNRSITEQTDALVEVRSSNALVNAPPNIINEALIQSLSQTIENDSDNEKNLYQLEEQKNSQITLSKDCIRICRHKNENDKQSISENALEIRDPFLSGLNKVKVELSHNEEVFLRQLASQAHNMTYIYANQYTFLDPESVSFDSSSMIGILLPESSDSFIEIVARVTDGHRFVRNSEGEFAPI